MSSAKYTIIAEKRELSSKSTLKALRVAGKIPANVYGKKGSETILIGEKNLPKEHPRASLINLEIGGAKKTVIMREVQVDPLTDKPVHFDFQEVAAGESVKVRVPLKYVGLTREQEKEGSFKTLLRSLEVRVDSGKIPEELTIDVSGLKIDESAHISDIKNLEGVRVLAKKNLALASLVRL